MRVKKFINSAPIFKGKKTDETSFDSLKRNKNRYTCNILEKTCRWLYFPEEEKEEEEEEEGEEEEHQAKTYLDENINLVIKQSKTNAYKSHLSVWIKN